MEVEGSRGGGSWAEGRFTLTVLPLVGAQPCPVLVVLGRSLSLCASVPTCKSSGRQFFSRPHFAFSTSRG